MALKPGPHAVVPHTVQRGQARLRLFCFPYAGAAAQIFRSWSGGLPETIDVCAVELPGRGTRLREAPFRALSPLVRALSGELRPYLDRPALFFGHSMGALIAFEVARHLQKEGRSTHHLFVSGRSAPRLPPRDRPLHAMPDARFIEELRALGGTPERVLQDPDLMRMLLPVLRADFALCETYVYDGAGSPIDCPITAFGGCSDPEVGAEQLQGWRAETGGSFCLRLFPGDHWFLHTARSLVMEAILERLRGEDGPEPWTGW